MSAAGVLANEQIDGLVARAVSDQNLGLEEATAVELKSLLARLEHSVGLVKDAIARMPTGPGAAADRQCLPSPLRLPNRHFLKSVVSHTICGLLPLLFLMNHA